MLQLMDDLRSAEVDFLTIGQYLQPTTKHHPVVRFVTPDEFKSFETIATTKGFLLVSASPLTRSSHHAGEDFAKLKAARLARLGALTAAMPSFRTTRRVRHTPASMFDLVADVEQYPQFLPLCEDLKVAPQAESGEGRRDPRGRHDRRLQGHPRDLHQPRRRWTGRALKILVEYIDGPFRHAREPLVLPGRAGGRQRGRVLHRLRVPQPHAGPADGRDVRPGLPQIRGGLRGARQPSCMARLRSGSPRARRPESGRPGAQRPASSSRSSASRRAASRTPARPRSP